ncbi:hypothetical protein MKEN_00345600 [Mycena kentingensis (nom. inval.)]|nr:hypothetical protein MKEN_00345600 [Mycena kentingensis (nom. inval.)]
MSGFSFTFSIPGFNPFSSAEHAQSAPGPSNAAPTNLPTSPPRARPARPNNVHARRPSPSPVAPVTGTRKRGWEPSHNEPSSSATLASPTGYLDTPAKYREMGLTPQRPGADEFELDDMNVVDPSDIPPPAKRRRTLAGSIVSTAVSAAVIGAAVGLSVYRLWRDRGKDSEQLLLESEPRHPPPPPPYHQGEWKPQQPHTIEITPPTPMATPRRRKVRHGVSATAATRRHHRPRPTMNHANSFNPVFGASNGPSAMEDDAEASVEDQLDWMGDKLSMLIAEGQRALRSEVVIKSEIEEDAVDDGFGVWEEERSGPSTLSRSASPRQRKRPRNMQLGPPSYSSRPSSASPRNTTRFEFGSLPSRGTTQWVGDAKVNAFESGRGASEFGARSPEDGLSMESEEMRESMRRAREKVLKMRAGG